MFITTCLKNSVFYFYLSVFKTSYVSPEIMKSLRNHAVIISSSTETFFVAKFFQFPD